MRFASLGSGSDGNALVVEVARTRLMLDCGFSLRDTVSRLARVGLEPSDLSGIVVTHEHADHGGGVFPLASRFGIPVWLTHGTLAALREMRAEGEECAFNLNDSQGGFSVDRKSTRLNSSHLVISYAVFCLKKKKTLPIQLRPHSRREYLRTREAARRQLSTACTPSRAHRPLATTKPYRSRAVTVVMSC